MALIPAGEFKMGSPLTEIGRAKKGEDVRNVRLTRDFYIMKYELTQAEYESVIGENPSHFKACGSKCPVENVSWSDAVYYANRRSELEGYTPCYTEILDYYSTSGPTLIVQAIDFPPRRNGNMPRVLGPRVSSTREN